MDTCDWLAFLRDFSALLLEDDRRYYAQYGVYELSEAAHQRGYLGFAGATEAQILATETRLGTHLPPSYRAFLQASNGWEAMGPSFPGQLWPVEQIAWLRERNQETIDTWGTSHRSHAEHLRYQGAENGALYYNGAYMQGSLEVSDWGDASIVFLCPEVSTAEGEWECWQLASWYPGAARFASFQDWLVECLRELQRAQADG